MPTVVSPGSIEEYLGKEVGVSDWVAIDQATINAFADTTDDHQYIHVDPERAAQTPFGSTIAHGFLTLSMLSSFSAQVGVFMANTVMGINYGFDKIRFLAPVRVDRRIRGRFRLVDVQEKAPGQYLVKQEVTVEIEDEDKPALAAEWLAMFFTGQDS